MSARRFAATVTALIGLGTGFAGVWCLVAPDSFASAVSFPPNAHFVHDLGAFQLGVAASMLLALGWRDAISTVLGGFLVGNTVHTVNHVADLDLGGTPGQAWGLGAASVLTAGALCVRRRQLRR